MRTWIWTTILTLLPIAELRGGIPYALLKGNISWPIALVYCISINALVAPIAWLFLDTVHRLFLKWAFYARMFDRFIEHARHKLEGKVEKWGFWGVSLFVGIPLPITGAWTGTLGAWVLGISRRKTMFAVLVGVIISGTIVTSIILLGLEAFNVFIRYV